MIFPPARFWAHNNSFTGGFDSAFCNNETDTPPALSSDCGGVYPQVNCTCCTKCCDDELGTCEEKLDAVCQGYKDSIELTFDETLGASCTCIDQGENLVCSFVDDCQFCNDDKSVCYFVDDELGYEVESDGVKGIFVDLQFVVGPVGDHLSLWYNHSSCTVHVNDEDCIECGRSKCLNGVERFVVDCRNIQDNLKWNGCEGGAYAGPLEIFADENFFFGTCVPKST